MPVEDVWIPMEDGVRLAATLFLPDGDGPWPALLEALPYRKDDLQSSHRRTNGRLAAEFGYVVCRLDLRGTGSSGGIMLDEYTEREHDDLVAVIDWLATREWSTGAVGMFGTSWGGFNALQVAMRRPPALRAICAIYASDDRYADDVHYFGGALKQLDLVDWPLYMLAENALPPVPRIHGEGWREAWRERVEASEPWIFRWLEHQTYDAYWKHGSLIEDPGAIEAATMLVTGWADGYTNIALRGMERMRCPRRLLAGAWGHVSTETGIPGPNVDLVPEMARWWDRWLKGIDNGVDREPALSVFMRRPTPPAFDLAEYRGAWRAERGWPVARLAPRAMPLASAAASADRLAVRGDTGATAWISCAGSLPWGQPVDQRPDEAHSVVCDFPVQDAELEILGHPRLRARVTSSAPVAFLSAKLCDVHPDGTSQLVTRGFLNLTHRTSRERPEPLVAGEPVDVEVEFEVTSWVFEVGHRIRLDLAGTDWPNAWPPPAPVTLAFDLAASELELPVLDAPPPDAEPPRLAPPRVPRSADPWGGASWSVVHDPRRRETVARTTYGEPSPAEGDVPAMSSRYEGECGVSTEDPGRAWVDAFAREEIAFPEATVASRAHWRIESDATGYDVAVDLEVSEDGEVRWTKAWSRRFPRNLQ